MNLNYRNAAVQDIEKIRELGLISYGQFKDVLGDQWQVMKANFENMNYVDLLSFAHGFVCETEKDMIGMAFLIPSGHPTDIYSADTSYIRLVGVKPEHTGKGIARKLTSMCIESARQLGEKTIMLHTSEFMDAARHIYESLGFIKIKDLHKIFGKHYFLYELRLRD